MTQCTRLLQELRRRPLTKVQAMSCAAETKAIPGFSHYFAGDDGKIYSDYSGRLAVIVGGKDKDGYAKHVLCEAGVRHYVRAHVAVAMAWIGPVPDGFVVAHEDGDLTNNKPSNLKICTQKENVADKERHGTKIQGSDHPRAKITEEQARVIIESPEAVSNADLAKNIGVRTQLVYMVRTGRTWKHIGRHIENEPETEE